MATVNKSCHGVRFSKKSMKAPLCGHIAKGTLPSDAHGLVASIFTRNGPFVNSRIGKPLQDAIKAFAEIQLYMGDGPRGAAKSGNWATLMAVLHLASQQGLSDEIFCQLIKQTTAHPMPSNEVRGWELLAGCVHVATPSAGQLLPYLQQHAFHRRLEPSPIGALALHVFQKLLPKDVPQLSESVRATGAASGHFSQSILATIKSALPPSGIFDTTLNETLRLESLTENIDNDKQLSKSNEFAFAKKQVVPAILILLTDVIRSNGGFSTEGLFRLAADAEDVAFYKVRRANAMPRVQSTVRGTLHISPPFLFLYRCIGCHCTRGLLVSSTIVAIFIKDRKWKQEVSAATRRACCCKSYEDLATFAVRATGSVSTLQRCIGRGSKQQRQQSPEVGAASSTSLRAYAPALCGSPKRAE